MLLRIRGRPVAVGPAAALPAALAPAALAAAALAATPVAAASLAAASLRATGASVGRRRHHRQLRHDVWDFDRFGVLCRQMALHA